MANGGIDCKGLENLVKKLGDCEKRTEIFISNLTKELAARLLAKVIKRTPVGNYSSRMVKFTTKDGKKVSFLAKQNGKVGGTLRRGWTGGKNSDRTAFVSGLKVVHSGNIYSIIIKNDVKYASYVEYGHRTRGGGFVLGRFMLTISEDEIQKIAPQLIEKRIENFLKGVFK